MACVTISDKYLSDNIQPSEQVQITMNYVNENLLESISSLEK